MNRALSRAAAVTFLPALALTIVFSARVTDFGGMDGYPVGLFSQAALTVGVVAPLAAALAAWQAHRVRVGQVTALAPVRTSLQQGLGLLAPVAVSGLACLAAPAFLAIWLSSKPNPSDAHVLIPAVLTVFAGICLGHALGTVLPVAVAVPTVLVGIWAWLAFPISAGPPWLRHLTLGWAFDCCTLSRVPDPSVILAPSIVALAIITGWAAWMSSGRRVLTAPVALMISIAGIALAVGLVDGRAHDPTQGRSPADLRCAAQGATRVCVWPETAGLLVPTQAQSRKVRDRLEALGLSGMPQTISAADSAAGAWHVVLRPGMSDEAIRESLVSGLTFPAYCGPRPVRLPTPATEFALESWIRRGAGVAVEPMADLPPDVTMILTDVAAMTPPDQVAWFIRSLPGSDLCRGTSS